MIRWPGKIKPGTQIREIAGAIDILPTLSKLTGVARVGTKPLDGVDLSPLLFGTATNWSDRMIISHQNGNVSARSLQYRYDNRGELFDMVADPRLTTDVAAKHADVAAKMGQAVATWRKEVFGSDTGSATPDAQAKAKGGKKNGKSGARATAGQGSDGRPFTVGYREMPRAPLPARDGLAHGGVKRSGNAPNSSYFTNWTSPDDSMTWDIEVHETGNYAVAINYTCTAPDVGSTVEVSFKNSSVTGKVSRAWDPPLNDHEDRVPRVGESFMKDFQPLQIGTMHMEAGRGLLTLRAKDIKGKQVMDVRLVSLTLQ
jgi:hypothetical protein